METGIELIAKERQEQVEKHNWTAEHDDGYTCSEMAQAAVACLLLDECVREGIEGETIHPFQAWPWMAHPYLFKIQDKDRIGQLAVAGAFIAAEIDRLQREKSKAQ